MTAFATASAGPLTAEPNKRVNYTFGLVLGVDEFQQDQLYHAAGRRWHNSLLHGYGTVWGLSIRTPEVDESDPELRVAPGVAVDPCGREICVPDTMCVRLSGWLARHRDTLEPLFPGGATDIPLAVVLCYRECPDDVVPIPGEPCRTQEDAMQPSRLRDSFELRLALREEDYWGSPPGPNETGLHSYRTEHAEEAAVRALGRLLARIQLVSVDAPGTGRDDLLAAVRALADEAPASPPEDDIVLAQSEAAEAYREALRVWAVEVRPRLRRNAGGADACGPDGHHCCVLLAEIDLPVTAGWALAGTAITANQENRPILLHSRLLQEWIASGASGGNDDTFATMEPVATDTVRLWLHYPDALDVDADDIQVIVNGGAAEAPAAVSAVGGSVNSFDVQLGAEPGDGAEVELRINLATIEVAGTEPVPLTEALHSTQGGFLDRYGTELRAYTVFRVLSSVLAPYAGDLSGVHPNATVVGLRGAAIGAAPPVNGNVLIFSDGSWAPGTPPAGALPASSGDVSGTYPGLTVVALQGNAVSDTDPTLNQYLRWNGSQWAPSHAGGFVYASAGRYAVVAAGHFNAGGPALGPVYNALAMVSPIVSTNGDGSRNIDFLLAFDDYAEVVESGAGATRHTYIVHAWFHPATGGTPVGLTFRRFEPGGIRMRHTVPAPGTMPAGRHIIEIHRIG